MRASPTPDHLHFGAGAAATDSESDSGDHEAQEPLAIGGCRGVGAPERGQVCGEAPNFLRLEIVEGAEFGFPPPIVFALEPGNLGERCLSTTPKSARDKAIVGIHRVVLASCQAGFIARTFEVELPLPVHRTALAPEIVECDERGLEDRRTDSVEERVNDERIDSRCDERLAHWLGPVGLGGAAFVPWPLASAAHAHMPPAAAAVHEPL
nr:hypothetical protein [Pseudoroseomonas wenyumeiae]